VDEGLGPAGRADPRARQASLVRWLVRLAPVLLALFVVAGVFGTPAPGATGRGLAVAIALAAFPVAVLGRNHTADRGGPLHVGFVGLAVVAAGGLVVVQPNGPGAAALLVAVLFVARLVPVRVAVPLLVATSVGALVFSWAADRSNVAVVAALAVVYGLLYLAFRLRSVGEEAERLLAELADTQAERERAAGLAARQDVAREVHDVLAHALSGMVLQLEAARILVARDPTDPRLAETITRAHRSGRDGLREARRAVATLRDDDLPGPARLPELTARWEGDHGVPCRLRVTGEPGSLPPAVGVAIYRAAQEALTNAARHAGPESVVMTLHHAAETVSLTVEDRRGSGRRVVDDTGPGHGLTGMRERAELLGGTLTAAPTEHGFRVVVELPR
jgi:signal transduction histidine kinase